ncbi:pectin lyase fold/virulence factor [Xylariales sp. PMI_506]|nr:pectin lyase fold/virulence factor [Xylariales sp. PMI_506]
MKFTAAPMLLLAGLAAATPTNLRNALARRAAADACDIGYCTQNGGTTGGASGETVTVTDVDSLVTAAKSDDPMTIIISGALTGADQVRVGSNKTIYGESGSSLEGVGFYVKGSSNVILRNLKISKVLAENGDAIGIQASNNVWVDHCDLSSDMDHDKDYYDGLVDISHAAEWVTISNTHFHDHWKCSLTGHSDNNADEDTGHLHVTHAGNYFSNIYSRGPLVRFGTVHIVNTLWEGVLGTGVNTRMGAQVYIESSAFSNCTDEAVVFEDSDYTGYAVLDDVDLGGSTNSAPEGNLTLSSFPYDAITPLGSASIASSIPGTAGQLL